MVKIDEVNNEIQKKPKYFTSKIRYILHASEIVQAIDEMNAEIEEKIDTFLKKRKWVDNLHIAYNHDYHQQVPTTARIIVHGATNVG